MRAPAPIVTSIVPSLSPETAARAISLFRNFRFRQTRFSCALGTVTMHTCSHRQNANLPTAVVEFETECPELDELRAFWRTAATAAGNAFITPEWFFAWLQVNAAAKPVVAVARPAGGVRGLLSLLLEDATLRLAGARFGDRV